MEVGLGGSRQTRPLAVSVADRNSLASECEFDMLASFYSSSGMTNDELQVPIMGCGRDFFFLVGAL
jgi:hypothetical protein